MVINRCALLLTVTVIVGAAAIGAVALVDQHLYGVSLFGQVLPERVRECGRSFRVSDPRDLIARPAAEARYPGQGTFEQVGGFHPPLHTSMEILGRPQLTECGMVLFVGTDDDHLAEYVLMGGP